MADPTSGSKPPSPAEALFLAWLKGGRPDFEAFCRKHSEHAEALQRLHEEWRRVRGLIDGAGTEAATDVGRSFAERLKEKYGSGVDPGISLDPGEKEARDLPSSELLRRLAERTLEPSRYRPLGQIAIGGMGAIFKIWDEDLRRSLAMKVMLGGEGGATEATPGDRRTVARFLEEAQVTGQLDHPGVVPVHELGLDSEGRVFFTMKLVKGRDLKRILDLVFAGKEGWNETRALGVILKVCEAMAYAHAKGVIHRDLKPGNVMVGNFGEVYVMDWGLARVLGRKDTHDIRLRPDAPPSTTLRTERAEDRFAAPDSPLFTMDGDIVGTPCYMPPEQARGEIGSLSARSDVYSIGAMLYHLLGRQMPFVPPGVAMTNRTVLARLLEGPPARLERIRSGIPGELVAICEKAMEREAERRYRDTLELADDLRAYLEHRVVRAYRTGAVVELRKWVQRNKGLAAASAAGVLALVAGLVSTLVLKTQADRNAAIATARADDVLRLSALQDLDDLVADADRLWPAHPENIARYEAWLERAERLVAALPLHEESLAELRSRATPWTEEDRAKQRATHPRLPEYERVRRRLEFHRRLREALGSREPRRDPTPEEVGLDLASLPAKADEVNARAWPLIDPDRKDWGGEPKGLLLVRRAVELAADLPPPKRAGIRDTLAWALFANGRFEEAVAEAERALEEAGPERRQEFEGYVNKLRGEVEKALEAAKEGEHVAGIERELAALEAEISARPEWDFQETEDKWWHAQLAKLVEGLKEFSHPEEGLLSSGISAKYGWGVEKRLEFARTLEERSVAGADVKARWAEAMASIRDRSQCPMYGGLEIGPQVGLLPIGRDPDSGLWEFAHLQTGEPPERGADAKLVLKEETGLVFVLLPGGTFSMGAQASDPGGSNYDPHAKGDEGPVHEVTLSPFFLSKHEMTQGQWLRFLGRNPSYARPQTYSLDWNGSHRKGDLLHPVEQVSWNDCMRVSERLGLVLPSEAQWEYGARGGTTTVWWTGDDKESLGGSNAANLADRYAKEHGGGAWVGIEEWLDDGYTSHAPIGTYAANAFGLHEVHGNLWEWCRDGYQGDFYTKAPHENPLADPAGSPTRVVRGGAFSLTAALARSAGRDLRMPEGASNLLGLRPARVVTAGGFATSPPPPSGR